MSQQRHNIFMVSVSFAVPRNCVQQFLFSAKAGKRSVIRERLVVAGSTPNLALNRKVPQLPG